MKLNKEAVGQFETLLQTITSVGIDKLIIADGLVRGIDDKQSIVLISKDNVPNIGKTKIGMNRIVNLLSRINLLKSTGDYNIEIVPSKDNTIISHFQLTSKDTSVQYRCASPDSIKSIPKVVNDKLQWLISIPAKNVGLLSMAISAMAADVLTITAKRDGSVFFEAVDVNNDAFSNKFATQATWIPEEDDEPESKAFVYPYIVKTVLPLFKAACSNGAESFNVMIGEKGILTIIVNGYDFFVPPAL